jgi:hypothetical protein
MTEASYAMVTRTRERVMKRVLGAIGKFCLAWMRFVARVILLFWHYGG